MTPALHTTTHSTSTRSRAVRRHVGRPLYLQIRDDLVNRIEHGELALGDRLPSEPDLALSYGVGRPTVRQAIDVLRRAGMVSTVRGSGTFVVSTAHHISLLHFDGLTPSLRARGIEPSDAVISAKVDRPPIQVLTILDPDDDWWLVERVRSMPSRSGPKPFCVESDAFNLRFCPEAADMFAASGSASTVLDEGYGFTIAHCDVVTRADTASAVGVARPLGISRNAPVLVMERLNWNAHSEPVHAVRYVISTDHVPVVERLVNPMVHDRR